jgi:RimJ/RimL family protein N-acetyltransferase
MVEIRTQRLLLRRARMDDLDAIHGLLTNPQAMRYWSTPPLTGLAQSEEWLRSMVEADLSISDDFIVEREGRVVGKTGCWRLPEVGFLFDPVLWGQGYASEALVAYLQRRREVGSPEAIRADVDPRNVASRGLLERHGFVETHRKERTWNVGGEWCDSIYFELRL